MYYLFLVKRWAEDVLMLPFIMLGRLIALVKPLDETFDIFFFFPFYAIGGAEKVHAHIVQAVAKKKSIIYFTRRSKNDLFLQAFSQSGATIRDISGYTDNKWLYPLNIIYRGIISGYINAQKKAPVVFNGQCNFGYKLSPWIKKRVPQVELIHSFNSFSWIRIPFLPFYIRSVMISHQTISDHQAQYKKLKVPQRFAAKIEYIQNGIELPDNYFTKTWNDSLVLLYVGRGTQEKRVHLIAGMAKALHESGHPVTVQFLGDVQEAIPQQLQQYCQFFGPQSNPAFIQKIYRGADVLVLTSVFEGFPMVVMEAMAAGLAIISTAVGDLPYHIKDGQNGFLIQSKNERDIINEGVTIISKMIGDKNKLAVISKTNSAYARKYFGIDAFNKTYLRLFESLQR